MIGYITRSIYYYLGYDDEEVKPDEKTLRVRNEMLKQIKKSKIILKSNTPKQKTHQLKPIKFNKKKTKNKCKAIQPYKPPYYCEI